MGIQKTLERDANLDTALSFLCFFLTMKTGFGIEFLLKTNYDLNSRKKILSIGGRRAGITYNSFETSGSINNETGRSMNLAKRIRDLRYSKGWGPDELANRAKISRTALYQIERGNTSKPQAWNVRQKLSRALAVAGNAIDCRTVLWDDPSSEGSPEGGTYSHATISGSLKRSLSSDRADELIEKFRMLLGSPLADGIARIVEESFRLLPIIPPPVAQAEPGQKLRAVAGHRHASEGPRHPRITTSE